MSFTFSSSIVFTFEDLSDIRLYDSATPVISSVYSGGSNRGSTFFISVSSFNGRPVDNIWAFFETWYRVSGELIFFVTLPRSASFYHSFFAWEPMLCSVFCDKLVPSFRHVFFCLYG